MNGKTLNHFDVIIIGAGAAGLMCAITAGSRGRRVLVLDHANKVGKKILMSGGGRCNFTNVNTTPENFISHNPHFAKSALSRYTPWDFIAMVEKHQIPYHEKKLGQLFCDRKSKDIVNMLLNECDTVSAKVKTQCDVQDIKTGQPFHLKTSHGQYTCESLVVATGGLSIPTMGATGFGYAFARSMGLKVWPTSAALVPFTLTKKQLKNLRDLSGISLDSITHSDSASFRENILFTHRGLSGPAVLQISSYWNPGEPVEINLFPDEDLRRLLESARTNHPTMELKNWLSTKMINRVAQRWCDLWLPNKQIAQLSNNDIELIVSKLQPWTIYPAGTEGYRTAEVTIGGVDTDEFSSKTMECRKIPGLHFIGEVLDVTGHLGGYNFQWAWASGNAAGQYV